MKLAVVDIEQVISRSDEGKALQERLNKFQQDFQNEIGSRQQNINRIRQRLEVGVVNLNEDSLTKLQQEFDSAQTSIRRFADDKQREAQKMHDQGLSDIEKLLNPIITIIRNEGGYDIILRSDSGAVISWVESIDISDIVAKRLTEAK